MIWWIFIRHGHWCSVLLLWNIRNSTFSCLSIQHTLLNVQSHIFSIVFTDFTHQNVSHHAKQVNLIKRKVSTKLKILTNVVYRSHFFIEYFSRNKKPNLSFVLESFSSLFPQQKITHQKQNPKEGRKKILHRQKSILKFCITFLFHIDKKQYDECVQNLTLYKNSHASQKKVPCVSFSLEIWRKIL